MFTMLLIIHILVAVFLVIAILLQSGQGGAISSAFGGGGGGNQTLFGGRGAASFLTRATTYLGASFLVLSLALAYVQAHQHAARQAAAGRNIIQENLKPSQGTPSQGGEGAGAAAGAPAETPSGAPSEVPVLPNPTPAPAGGK
jgi:preprotein translocase subunit SecG